MCIRDRDYAHQQMDAQEYQQTRQAQALGMSSMTTGPVRMPGTPITYAPPRTRSRSRGTTPQTQVQSGMTPPQGALVAVPSGFNTPPIRRGRTASSQSSSRQSSTGLSSALGEIIEEDQGTLVPRSGSGKYKRKAKAKPKLNTIKEDVVEVIKPSRNHLPYLDLNNDLYLINKIRK